MILDCDRLWTEMVTLIYRVRRMPRVTNDPPAIKMSKQRNKKETR